MTLKVPPVVQSYAEAFAEYRKRTGFTPFSTRQAFDGLDDESVRWAIDRLKNEIANTYGVYNDAGEHVFVGASVCVILPMTAERWALLQRMLAATGETLTGYAAQALDDRLGHDALRG